jgi:hypothetical protein
MEAIKPLNNLFQCRLKLRRSQLSRQWTFPSSNMEDINNPNSPNNSHRFSSSRPRRRFSRPRLQPRNNTAVINSQRPQSSHFQKNQWTSLNSNTVIINSPNSLNNSHRFSSSKPRRRLSKPQLQSSRHHNNTAVTSNPSPVNTDNRNTICRFHNHSQPRHPHQFHNPNNHMANRKWTCRHQFSHSRPRLPHRFHNPNNLINNPNRNPN